MTYFDECLTLGQWLSQEDRRALYKFLLRSKKATYTTDAIKLIKSKNLTTTIANGEIQYLLDDNKVKYVSRKIGSQDFTPVIRELKLGKTKLQKKIKLARFFAQSEVDVLSNYPLPGLNKQKETGFTCNTYPYYDLNYYSNGENKIKGFVNKFKTDDNVLIEKLKS